MSHSTNLTFGKKIQRARWRRDLTQTRLARAVGCGRLTITKIESGAQIPSLFLLMKIFDELGITELRAVLEEKFFD